MTQIQGLVGLRPTPTSVAAVTAPPYDVIRKGSPLEARLAANPSSIFHVTLGAHPVDALARLRDDGALVAEEEPCFYVYEQRFGGETRTGLLAAGAVSPYQDRQIIPHEKTFDDKVQGRIALARATGFTLGPVFLLVRAALRELLGEAKQGEPFFSFVTDFGGTGGDLDGIVNRVWRVPEASDAGQRIQRAIAPHALYIADGHHRYHAALLGGQRHFLCYITDDARISAYNRVISGPRRFADVMGALDLVPARDFATPPKHVFAIHSRAGTFTLGAKHVPDDVVGRLDCAILERELYPLLGLEHGMIMDPKHFDYFPERALLEMKALVDRGDHDLAVALHPVDMTELMAVADAGLDDPRIIMPEKSTFFTPKILTGLFVYRHPMR